jgi:glycosyltransferase involved in cell wall biosynthesis
MNLKKEGRILYISSIDISLSNGPGVNEREFITVFQKAFGERVHFLIPKPKHKLSGINENFTLSPDHKHYHPFFYLVHQMSQIRLAKTLIESGRFDFLVFRLTILPLAQAYITKRYRIPYAIKTLGAGVLNALKQQSGLKGNLGKALDPFHKKLIRNIISGALAIDVCTEAYLHYFQDRFRFGPTRLCCIENATNTERFCPVDKMVARSITGLSTFDPIVGFVGGRPWERGGSQMVEITPKLLERYPTLGVAIVGGGKGVEKLKKRAYELEVAKHCIFPGLVPYDQVSNYINAFDVCISFNKREKTDSSGNSSQKVRQYVACGKPVVSGPGGNRFLEKEYLGSIVKGADLEGISNAVLYWLSLTQAQREIHRDKAAEFARKNLSVEKALNDRLNFWNSKL